MIRPYDLYMRHEIFRALENLPDRDRGRLLSFIESLAANPFDEGDDVESDNTGRQRQIKIIGKYVVYYWVDHAESEVRITDLVDADAR